MREVNIIDKVLDEKYWDYVPPRGHYTGHMYRNSPYETDDSCGNCDGARCDYCDYVVDEPHFECSISVDVLENILIESGVPEEDASNIATSDWSYRSGDYYLVWPHDYHLEESHRDFYDKLIQKDEKIFSYLDSIIEDKGNGRFFASFDKLQEIMEVPKDRPWNTTIYHHCNNQYNMWRIAKGKEMKNDNAK